MKLSIELRKKVKDFKRKLKDGSIDINLNYIPQPKQKEMHDSKAEILLYGGAVGGGKSAALVADVSMYALEYPGSKSGLFRKTKNSARAVFVDEGFYKFVPTDLFVYNENKSRIEFINGSVVEINSLDNSTDKNKYLGDRWKYLGIDEVTLFRPSDVQFLETRCRSEENPDGTRYPRRIRYTANPGGPSHAYMKRLFIDRAFTANETPELYYYIFSNIEDNKYLKEDVGYYKQLMSMPDAIKKRFYDGDWSIGEGVFLDRFDPMTTIVTPFEIPSHWRRYRALDYGYTDATVVGWFAISPTGIHYMYRELSCTKQTVEEIAQKMKFLSKDETYVATFADPSVFASSGIIKDPTYRSAGLVFRKHNINLIPANNDRKLGGMMMREFLSPVEVIVGDGGETVKRSKLMIFNICKVSLDTVPHLVSDLEDPDDIEHGRGKKQDDHAYDMIRYYLASHAGAHVSYAEQQEYSQSNSLRNFDYEQILNEIDRRNKTRGKDLSLEGLMQSNKTSSTRFETSKDRILDNIRRRQSMQNSC